MTRRRLVFPAALAAGLATLAALALAWPTPAAAFGKNKIQYEHFRWRMEKTEHFEIYYYPEEAGQVPLVAAMAEAAYDRISAALDFELTLTIPIIVYLTHSDFEQTNVVTDFIGPGIGGFNEPIKRRIVLPLEGRRRDLQALITHELVHSFEFDMFYQFRITGEFEPVPIWIMEGLAQQLAYDWRAVDTMVLRDTIVNGYAPELSQLQDWSRVPSIFAGYKLSHSAVEFLYEHYGIKRMQRFLWEIRRTVRKESAQAEAFEKAFGEPIEIGSRRWQQSLRERFAVLETVKEPPSDYGLPIHQSRPRQFHSSPAWSPGGGLVAAIVPGRFRQEVALYPADPGDEPPDRPGDGRRRFRTLTESVPLGGYLQIEDQGTGLAWSADGESLAFIARLDRGSLLYVMDVPAGRVDRRIELPLDAPASPSFSPAGLEIALAGYREARSDIFAYDLDQGTARRLTEDEFVDVDPVWSPDGRTIAYVSERDGHDVLVLLGLEDGRQQVLLERFGHLAQPAWSRDGRALFFISDLYHQINNVYRLDLATGSVARLTDTIGGCFAPSPSPDGRSVAFACYWDARQDIYVIPSDRRPEGIEDSPCPGFRPVPWPEAPEAAVAAPDFGPLQDAKVPFRLLPDIFEGGVGYSSDGVFFVDGDIILSDMLGDHQVLLSGARETSRNGFLIQYLYLKRRYDFGGAIFQQSEYYYFFGERFERTDTGGLLLGQYPFDIFRRLEASLTYYRRSDEFGGQSFHESISRVGLSLVGDTARFGSFGPISGARYRIGYAYPIEWSSGFVDADEVTLDLRRYLPLSRRSLVALRLIGAFSNGGSPEIYSYGGAGTVRGLEFGADSGSRVMVGNAELRFPLLDRLAFAGGIPIGDVRGLLFWDAGIAWNEGEDVDLWENDRLADVESTVGAGFSLNFLGLPLNFEFAFPTDLAELERNAVYQFSIRFLY